MNCTVIIPHYNDPSRLALCLDALERQTLPREEYEVVVVDNGSAQNPAETLSERFPRVRFLVERKPGSYAARNHALRETTGETLAFTDSDCIPESTWLEHGIRALAADEADALGGRIMLFPRDEAKPSAAELYDLLHGLRQEEYIADGYAATANMMTTRGLMERTGFFDESLRSGGDREWGQRATSRGARLVYAPDAIIRHPARASLREILQKARRTTAGAAQVRTIRRSGAKKTLFGGIGHLFRRLLRMAVPSWSNFDRVRAAGSLSLLQRCRVMLCIVLVHYNRVFSIFHLRLGGTPQR